MMCGGMWLDMDVYVSDINIPLALSFSLARLYR